eukprot:scaffold248699_cov68-Attheya_sp.AAC.1
MGHQKAFGEIVELASQDTTGYPVIVVPYSEKAGYIHAIKCWQNGDARPLINFMADLLEDSFTRYFRALYSLEK